MKKDINNEFVYYDDDEIEIDWGGIFRKILSHWKLFLISAILTAVIVDPIVKTIPKYYSVTVRLIPEGGSGGASSSSSGLSGLMGVFGISGGSSSGSGFGPALYPELMNSNAFLITLFDIPVVSKDGKIKTTYAEYLAKYQDDPIWKEAEKKTSIMLHGKPKEVKEGKPIARELTPRQQGIATAISKNVKCELEGGIMNITVQDQDPLICATVADSACSRLQQFITEFRSKKERKNLLEAEKQYKIAMADYNDAKQKVQSFNDSNWDLVKQDYVIEQEDLQNRMQLAYQTMSSYKNQLMNARIKYQVSIPVFTVLDDATIPLSPEGGNTKKYVIAVVMFVLFIEGAWVLLKDTIKKKIHALRHPAPQETQKPETENP